jgi:glutamate-ammonia-ligase adenylyltransferase
MQTEALHVSAGHALAPAPETCVALASACWDGWTRYPSARSASARTILADLKPRILAAAQASGDAGEMIGGFDSLVRQLSVGTHLFASLAAEPAALACLLALVTRAPRLAAKLAERPDLFDALLAGTPSADTMSAAELLGALAALRRNGARDAELLRAVQRFTRKHQFLIGARTALGLLPFGRAALAFSTLALAVVPVLAGLSERQFQKRHGRVPGTEWALVALGKFGSLELTATSDLDLMFVYDTAGAADADDGSAPTTHYFNKLAQHVIAVVGSADNDGPLFEIDFRLRPWGTKGPIATRLSTLRDYLERDAWTYERMAMTRARVVCGSQRLAAEVASAIGAALERRVEREKLRTDVLDMRALVHAAKDTTNPWDIKHVRGGLMDVELLAQYLMLRDVEPRFIHAATADALRHPATAGRLDAHDFETLSQALSLFRDVMQATRAGCLPGPLPAAIPPALAAALPALVGESSLAAVEATLVRLQAQVQTAFDRLAAA